MKYQIHNKDYKEYDRVVQTIMTNIFIERGRDNAFILYNFCPNKVSHKLYFNVTSIAANLNKEKFYLDMPLIDYIKLKIKRGKNCNFKWFNPIHKIKNKPEITVSEMMNFICKELNISETLYADINNEYYGWID